MNESNISRDHIAMEVMKILLDKSIVKSVPLIDKIRAFFGMPINAVTLTTVNHEQLAKNAYKIADKMIKEREKDKDNI